MNCEFMLNRCFTTGNRSYLPSISDFDAIIMNQRSIDWEDMPKKSQRWFSVGICKYKPGYL